MSEAALQTKKIKVHDLSLDGVRLIAILMVIMIHVSAKGFAAMGSHWWAVNVYESVSRVAVPMFFMVTGALLLFKETSARISLRRIWRIALPLFAWSILYLCWFRYTGTSVNHWVRTIMRVPVVPHFWYLYTLIGVYIFLPVMIGFCKIENKSSQYLALAGWFFGSCIAPLLYALMQKTFIGVEFNFLPLYAGYMVAGALIYKRGKWPTVSLWWAAAVWFLCSSAIAIFTWKHSLRVGHADETFYVYSCPFVVIEAFTSFILLRELLNRLLLKNRIVARVIASTAKLNFGVYIVHILVMFWLDLSGLDYSFINPWIGIPVTSIAILLISGVLVHALQQIPYVRQTVPA